MEKIAQKIFSEKNQEKISKIIPRFFSDFCKNPAINLQMREIAYKMERVDQEFQRRDVTILRLDEKLKDGQNMVQSLAKALHDAEKNILAKNHQLADLQKQLDLQKQTLDAQELKEFLHVENQASRSCPVVPF